MRKLAVFMLGLLSLQGFGLMGAAIILGAADWGIVGAVAGVFFGLFSVWLQPQNGNDSNDLGGLKW